jgi:hypothetical protein
VKEVSAMGYVRDGRVGRGPLLTVVVATAGGLGVLFVVGFAVVAAGQMPWWVLPVVVGAVAIAAAVGWLVGNVSHGGAWTDRRSDRGSGRRYHYIAAGRRG